MKALRSSNSTPSASAWTKSSRRRERVDYVLQALKIASSFKMFICIANHRCCRCPNIQFFSTNFPLNCPDTTTTTTKKKTTTQITTNLVSIKDNKNNWFECILI